MNLQLLSALASCRVRPASAEALEQGALAGTGVSVGQHVAGTGQPVSGMALVTSPAGWAGPARSCMAVQHRAPQHGPG